MMKYDNVASVPRERKSVPILGLDTSTPDDLVEDGKCAELNNLRYKDGAWRGVNQHKLLIRLLPEIIDEYEIVYHHPAAGEKTAIAFLKNAPECYLIDYSQEDVQPLITFIAEAAYDTTISHFGNILIFYRKDKTIQYFLFANGSYKPISIPTHAITEVTASATDYSSTPPQLAQGDNPTSYGGYKWEDASDLNMEEINSGQYRATWYPIYNITQGHSCIQQGDRYWSGELLLFTTWMMKDGTTLSPSPLHIVKSNGAYSQSAKYTKTIGITPHPKDFQSRYSQSASTSDVDQYLGIRHNALEGEKVNALGDPTLRKWLPTLTIRLLSAPPDEAFESIAVWCTRVYPIYSPEGELQRYTNGFREEGYKSSNSYIDYYADNDLANQPFYLLKEIPLSEFKLDSSLNVYSTSIPLVYSDLASVIHQRVYTPIQSASLIPDAVLDYNKRYHCGGGISVLPAPYNPAFANLFEIGDAGIDTYWADIKVDNIVYQSVAKTIRARSPQATEGSSFYRSLSYPDYRAIKFSCEAFYYATLREAISNNFAWYHQPHTENEKFPPIPYDERVDFEDIPPQNNIVEQPSLLRVSSANNLFQVDFANTYSFGSIANRILAMQSAAIQIADEKTGDLPLLVFTDEGIFALRAGTETLYARTDVINYDRIINPNTIAVNGGVIYITEKGVHLLVGRESSVISTPIHDINGKPPIAFLRGCKLILSKQYNEVMFFNESAEDGRAYVYNVSNGYWSTRNMTGKKLNTDELVAGNLILDASEEVEVESPSNIASFITRPIKLGDVEYKRLETIIPRMTADNCSWDIAIDASRTSPSQWEMLRYANYFSHPHRPAIIRRTPFSAKYFRFALTKGEGTGFSITHFDVEWYKKIRRRMR